MEAENYYSNKEISVIICVYNRPKLIRRCIDSVLNQSILNKHPSILQIIVVDDCSTDNTRQILDEYARQYPDLIEIYKTPSNLRLGGARNLGLEHVKGAWVSFLDSDDALAPDFYEKLLTRAANTGADMIGCYSMEIDENSGKILGTTKTFYPEEMGILTHEKYKKLISNWHTFWYNIYKSELLYTFQKSIGGKNFFPEGIFYEDEGVGPLLYLHAKHYEIVPETLYLRYEHSGQITKNVDIIRIRHLMEAANTFLDNAKKQFYFGEFVDEINCRFVILYLFITIERLLKIQSDEAKKLFNEIVQTVELICPDIYKNKYFTEYGEMRLRYKVYLNFRFTQNKFLDKFFCLTHHLALLRFNRYFIIFFYLLLYDRTQLRHKLRKRLCDNVQNFSHIKKWK